MRLTPVFSVVHILFFVCLGLSLLQIKVEAAKYQLDELVYW